jgi:hypothetical protein
VEKALSSFLADQKALEAEDDDASADGFVRQKQPVSIDFKKETKLPKDLKYNIDLKITLDALEALSWKNLFLTGATGFLGAFMLADLLSQKEQPVVKCLVRCKSEADGIERLRKTLNKFEIPLTEGTSSVPALPVR